MLRKIITEFLYALSFPRKRESIATSEIQTFRIFWSEMIKLSAFFMSTFLIILISACEKTVLEYNDNPYGLPELRVNQPIADILLQEGIVQYQVDLEPVFKIDGKSDAIILKSVQSNQNTALVSTLIIGNTLYLEVIIGKTGMAAITIRAEYQGAVVYDDFSFTVNAITANAAQNSAVQNFQNGDYESAAVYFQILIAKNEAQYLSDAYMGLGFSQMRSGDASAAYVSMQNSLSENNANLDAKTGMMLLEYAFKRNYSEALQYGQQVLSGNNNFVFRYDSSLDRFDVIVHIALSQFSLQAYSDCVATIQQIDPSFNPNPADSQYETIVLEKLNQLIQQYS